MLKIVDGVITRKEADGNTLLILTSSKGAIESIIVNDIGSEILDLCKKGLDESDIVDLIEERYLIENNIDVKEDINFFIDSLIERGWLENG